MIALLKKLFHQNDAPEEARNLNQEQREALIDLLLLGVYADNLISIAENQFLEDEVQELHWESGISLNAYFANAFHKVRDAREDEAQRRELIRDIGRRLGDEESKRGVLYVLKSLFEADETVEEEKASFNEIESILGVSFSNGGKAK